MELALLAKGILVGLGVLGPSLGIGLIFSKALEGISRNPQAAGQITTWMFVGAAMVEVFGLAAIVLFFLMK